MSCLINVLPYVITVDLHDLYLHYVQINLEARHYGIPDNNRIFQICQMFETFLKDKSEVLQFATVIT